MKKNKWLKLWQFCLLLTKRPLGHIFKIKNNHFSIRIFWGHPVHHFLQNPEMYNFIFNRFGLPWPSRFPKYVSLCLPNSNVIILLLPCCEQVEKLILENSKLVFWHSKFTFSKLDGSTSSYHNSTNTGPIDMFFTKKCNYFSRQTRWNYQFLSHPQLKGCFGPINI